MVFGSSLSLINLKKKEKKRCKSLTPSDITFWIRAWNNLKKQSDLGLCCLYRPFWQATGVRTSNIEAERYERIAAHIHVTNDSNTAILIIVHVSRPCSATKCSINNMLSRGAYCVPCIHNMLPLKSRAYCVGHVSYLHNMLPS